MSLRYLLFVFCFSISLSLSLSLNASYASNVFLSIQIPDDGTLDEHYISNIMDISTKGKVFTFDLIDDRSGQSIDDTKSIIKTMVSFINNKATLENLISIVISHEINQEEKSFIKTTAPTVVDEFLCITDINFAPNMSLEFKKLMFKKLLNVVKVFSLPLPAFGYQDLSKDLEGLAMFSNNGKGFMILKTGFSKS